MKNTEQSTDLLIQYPILDNPYLLAGLLFFYILPTIIALFRGHHNLAPIFVINSLLGWTGLFWILTLAWSTSHISKSINCGIKDNDTF